MSKMDWHAFNHAFGESMNRIPESKAPPLNFRPYFDALEKEEFEGFDCSEGRVGFVHQSDGER